MKKALSLLFCLLFFLCLTVSAFAESSTDSASPDEEETIVLFAAESEEEEETMVILGESEIGLDEGQDSVITIGAHPAQIVDYAGLLTEEERLALENEALRISETYDMDVTVCLSNTLDGKEPVDAADDFFDYNGYGRGEDRSGIVFYIAMESRDWWVSTRGRGIDVFNDGTIEYIFNDMSYWLSSGDFYAAFTNYLNDCEECLRCEANGEPIPGADDPFEPYPYDPDNPDGPYVPSGPTRNPALHPFSALLAIGAGFLLSMIPIGSMKKQINNVSFQNSATGYAKRDSLNLRNSQDIFLYQNVSKTPIVRNESSSGSSGGGFRSGGGVHTSSSGASHGGHGGKF